MKKGLRWKVLEYSSEVCAQISAYFRHKTTTTPTDFCFFSSTDHVSGKTSNSKWNRKLLRLKMIRKIKTFFSIEFIPLIYAGKHNTRLNDRYLYSWWLIQFDICNELSKWLATSRAANLDSFARVHVWLIVGLLFERRNLVKRTVQTYRKGAPE